MVFSSLQFIGIFLPVFFTLYYCIPKKYQDYVLLLGSFVFYSVGAVHHPEHCILLIVSILIDYTAGLLMERSHTKSKIVLTAAVGFHLLSFIFFKYTPFVTGEAGKFFSADVALDLVMPIGISFYTFQGISYLADIYRKKIHAEKSLLKFAVYIAMFEQLIAGPIVTYSKVEKELHNRKIEWKAAVKGFGIFILGLGLKVLLANPIGRLFTEVGNIGYESISTPLAWMAIFAYSFQLYFDFFGYSIMAVGLGEMLGFHLPKNFDFPYLSRSMTEFWRRWHITLGSWFREYVYIPLGGNQTHPIRNLFLVWVFTGLWHGASYTFLLWGLVLFLIIVLEKYFLGKKLKKAPVLAHVYMLVLIPLTWAIFAIDDLSQLGLFFTRLFPFFGEGPWSIFRYDYVKYLGQYWYFFIAAILFSTKLPFLLLKRIAKKSKIVTGILLFAIFIGSVYCMYRGLDDPFLYFRF